MLGDGDQGGGEQDPSQGHTQAEGILGNPVQCCAPKICARSTTFPPSHPKLPGQEAEENGI